MWKNYAHTLLRQLRKFKTTYSINLAGLAFGLACCLVCIVHIRYEFSFDQFHPDGDRIFRMVNGDPSTTDSWVKTAPPIPIKLKAEIPEVEEFVRLHSVTYSEKVVVEYGEKTFLEPYFLMADPNFFQVFHFPLAFGQASTVLADINSIAISRTIASKLFGQDDPVGKVIRLKDNQLDFTVTGVFNDLPANTHLRCDYLVSFENLDRIFGKGSSESWNQYNYFAYIKLHPAANRNAVVSKIQAITVDLPGKNQVSFKKFELQPITDIHFQHNRGNQMPSYDVRYIFIFSTLALSVLVICLMNYFNITAMLALKRVKEIGIRKSVGATGAQLNIQFILESLGLSLISLIVCIVLVELLEPLLSSWLGSPVEIPYTDPLFLFFVTGVTALLVLVSVGYLAFYVNRLRPGAILKGSKAQGGKGNLVQHSLIFFQFTLSIILLISSMVIVRQMQYMRNKDLGFDKDQVITVTLPRGVPVATLSSLRTELISSDVVENAAYSDFVAGRANWNQTTWWEGQLEPESMNVITVGKEFIGTMKMELLEGTEEEILAGTEMQMLINASARDYIGWTEGKGKFLSPFGEANKKAITGVVKDFHFRSLHNKIAPLVIVVYPERSFSQLYVRLAAGSIPEGLQATEERFKAAIPGLLFEFNFLDDNIDRLYEAERRMGNIVVVLTAVSVGFALLGIYTLISFAIENRTREVAIRKVLGISPGELLRLFTTSYFRIAMLAGTLAAPVCWILMSNWLTNFSEHVKLNGISFLAVILMMMALVVCIGFAKYFAMNSVNPAVTLKSE